MGSITPRQIQQRLEAFEQERDRRLLQRAEALRLRVSRDTITGGYAVRSPLHRGYVELVTAAGCTCGDYEVCHTCTHVAVVPQVDRRSA